MTSRVGCGQTRLNVDKVGLISCTTFWRLSQLSTVRELGVDMDADLTIRTHHAADGRMLAVFAMPSAPLVNHCRPRRAVGVACARPRAIHISIAARLVAGIAL
jgi:hypothetical protein